MGRQADGLPHLPKPGTWPCSNSSARTGVLALERRISLRASSAPTGETP
ncbi:putative o6-methylguanine-DNA methyltransferase [Pseudomonas aeruginosa]|nr:6-O-methylguanine DNA methyltransferase [Pseudomonas aeruginosa]MCO3278145.1 6-O-methylguanine DNA methyltransferase [Pseudomonas aeruginosa]OPD79261.1 6-O-methylguanine DNA methyltransferase [Pseudomonas aeruginosa]PBV93213.1 6-O-methylguanine DNA methyltransferase [Pseudomonas aeruginosa]PRV99414.1 putative o6-methylguanine-DNA methyltransferase [Pseudomonas aeruginosa]